MSKLIIPKKETLYRAEILTANDSDAIRFLGISAVTRFVDGKFKTPYEPGSQEGVAMMSVGASEIRPGSLLDSGIKIADESETQTFGYPGTGRSITIGPILRPIVSSDEVMRPYELYSVINENRKMSEFLDGTNIGEVSINEKSTVLDEASRADIIGLREAIYRRFDPRGKSELPGQGGYI